jgi:hypothetical protein
MELRAADSSGRGGRGDRRSFGEEEEDREDEGEGGNRCVRLGDPGRSVDWFRSGLGELYGLWPSGGDDGVDVGGVCGWAGLESLLDGESLDGRLVIPLF